MNVSRRLIATYRKETLTRYPFCVSTSQDGATGSNADEANASILKQVEVCHDTPAVAYLFFVRSSEQ